MEKLHVWDHLGLSKQIFLMVHRENLFFFYMYKETFYMHPISILTDIESIMIGEVVKDKSSDLEVDDLNDDLITNPMDYLDKQLNDWTKMS